MKKRIALLGVALMVCFAVGILYAARGGGHGGPGRGPGRGPGSGPGFGPGPGSGYDKTQLVYVEGTINSIEPGDENRAGKIVITRKGKDGQDLQATLLLSADTQVFIGDEEKDLSDLVVGSKVVAGCVKSKDGADAVAVLIRVPKDGKTTGKKAPDAGEEKKGPTE